MPTTTTKEFVLPIENKPGTFAEIATALGKANVNIQGFLVQAQGDYGVLRIVTSDPAKTESWLKTTNRAYRANDVLLVGVPNNPGELGKTASRLAQSGVNVLASYTSTVGANDPRLTFAVDDVLTAKKILS